MRPNANNRRQRGRGGRKSGNSRNQTYDSNGPGARVRGNPSQIYEKYQQLARDAASAGDRVGAENFLQHAEHYYRLMSAAAAKNEQRNNADENSRDENAREDASRKSDNGHGTFVEDLQADDASKPDGGVSNEHAQPKIDDDGDAKPNGRKRRSRRSNERGDSGKDGSEASAEDNTIDGADGANDSAGDDEGAAA